MATTIVNESALQVTTFLQWTQDESGMLHLICEPALFCPCCEQPCGYLYDSGLCLGCELDRDQAAIAAYKEQSRNDYFPATAA